MAGEMTSHLTSMFSQPVWEGKERENRERKERGKRKEGSLEREALPSLQVSRRLVRRIPARQEAKLIPTARATRG